MIFKKLVIIITIIFLLTAAAYLYVRFSVLKAKDFKPEISKQKNDIDLRPAIIAKLQQLVKDGSKGLYKLYINKLDIDVLASKADTYNASIIIDTAVMKHLDSLQLLPDDIFSIRFKLLHITGLGIDDLLHTNKIEISGIKILNPVIDIFHKKRLYNQAKREYKDTLTLYERLKGNMKKIAIDNIEVAHASIINHDLKNNAIKKYNDVFIAITDLLIDSTTQFDDKRFLFSKRATITTKNYSTLTPDSLYILKIGEFSISGDQHTIAAQNVELKPRLSREAFESRLHYGKDMYHFIFPKITLRQVNWQALINNEMFVSAQAEINGGSATIFFDRTKPQGPIKLNNFPQQVLMHLPFPLSIKNCIIKNLHFSYEEHNPLTDKNGTVYFDNLNVQIDNITNISAEIKRNAITAVNATALLMHHVPIKIKFLFDLSKSQRGDFIADIKVDSLDNATINPIAEPLGLFSVKKGQMQKALVHVQGNNLNTKGNITMLYKELHIIPLKKDGEGNLKKKTFTNILANIILIKNENPKGGELRQPDFTVERGSHKNFFNLLWASTLTGIVKTVGIPVKFVKK